MRNPLILLYLFFSIAIIQTSCKEKTKTHDHTQNENKEDKHLNHSEHKHYYGYQMEKSTASNRTPRPDDLFYYIKFGNSEEKYVKNSYNNAYFSIVNSPKVYKVYNGDIDSFITPINASLMNNKLISQAMVGTSVAVLGKGDFGCIPKFEPNGLGQVTYTDDPTNDDMVIVPLMVAYHKPFPADSIIKFLKIYNFKMLMTDYSLLNNLFVQNINIEAGLNTIQSSTLKKLVVYPIGEPELTIFEQN
jgi:hypothetical protein